MSIDMNQFLQTFFEESFEGLDDMENGLLNMTAGEPDVEQLNDIFRAAHSIKGGAGTFGLNSVTDLTHKLETLLDRLREGESEVTTDGINLLLASVDCLRSLLQAERDGTEADPQQAADITTRLAAMVDADDDDGSSDGNAGDDAGSSATADDGSGPGGGWRIGFTPEPHLFMTGNDPLRLLEELSELGEIQVSCDSSSLPALPDLDPEECVLSWTIDLYGDVERQAIEEVFEWVEDDCSLTIEPLEPAGGDTTTAAPETAPEPEAASAGEPAGDDAHQKPAQQSSGGNASTSSSIRVDTGKIDNLIDMVGELVITQSMLNELGENFTMDKLEKLQDGLAQLERNTRELQENVMRIRMVPISFAYSRLPRMVHDLMRQLGKKVDLQLNGEETELDKTVMEKIIDPLVHLVRNAMDHGIEPPEKRAELGKPETGTLEMNAYHKGGYIVIEINDDGGGISRDRLLNKAREAGLMENGSELSDEQVFDFIFHPGLSTHDEATDVSGRGVGMDVVKRNIKALGGNITVNSTPGKGTRFAIHLPLTLSILDGQLFRVGDQVYVVPLISIMESLQMQGGKIKRMAGTSELYEWRDDYIPIIRLRELFNEAGGGDLENELMVVVEEDDRYVGLHVDELLGQQQVVIKSLKSNYRPVTGFAGATILGNGTVALILDIAGLLELAQARDEVLTKGANN
ncbi:MULTISPECIES: chemotaxis protein CheA [Halomonadaceae]|uniref:Chemotaxis protein CheA n=1 Tax=Vreelandella halophila TaxID=86177 RepID=A0A9X5B4I7_9GAMM|nr:MULTISPECIES: chemotaxis protein CheA [Halomonas]MYL26576.1 chemotaxis protein CheA [Halomonas utahensis]MYL73913.1 chemotaxis protein CheA [Halomonas sp. 22501_18_FS]